MNQYAADFGKRVKARRRQLRLTQSGLAQLMGYQDKSSISKLEKGVAEINQSSIVKLAKFLQTTPSYLMGWDEGEHTISVTSEVLNVVKAYRNSSDEVKAIVRRILDV